MSEVKVGDDFSLIARKYLVDQFEQFDEFDSHVAHLANRLNYIARLSAVNLRDMLVKYKTAQPNNKGTYKVVYVDWDMPDTGVVVRNIKICADNDADAVIKWLDYVETIKKHNYAYLSESLIDGDNDIKWSFNSEDWGLERYDEIVL
jgi:hypothetical protein